MKRIIPLFLTLALILTCMVRVTVSAAADLSADFVKTYTEQTSSAKNADNLIMNTAGNGDCYMLWSASDIGGRNTGSFDVLQEIGVVDYDGKTRSILCFDSISNKTVNPAAGIEGALLAKNNSSRTYYNPSDISAGDKLVVSVYAKTKNAGTKTRFNLGFQNGGDYGYNAFTDTYGEDGMEVTDEWKQFKGVITIPEGYESSLIPTNYCLTMGYPGNMDGTMEDILVSNPYIAKAAAVDIKTALDSSTVNPGETTNIKTEILNQLGTTEGISQDVAYYVTNEARTEVLTDCGITVAADGSITVADSAEDGRYGIVAVYNDTMVSGKILTVESKPDLSKDFVKNYTEQTSSAKNPENLIKNTAGNEDCYMLFSGADIGGRNSGSFDVYQAIGVTDFDGKTRSILYIGGFSNQTVNSALGIEGALVAKDSSSRTYYTPSDINGGDKLIVSVYVKTKNEGTSTRFNMGFVNGAGYGYNAFTDTYGENGMEVTGEWKQFKGIITMPDAYSALLQTNYSLTFGYPTTMTDKMEEMLVSNLYVAKAAAVDIKTALDSSTVNPGETTAVKTEILNQLGTTEGVLQGVTYYVTNEDRTEVLEDCGITITENGTVSAANNAAPGTYYVVAVSNANKKMVSGAKLEVAAENYTVNLTKSGNGTVSYTKADGTEEMLVSGTNTVEAGEKTFTFTPDEGYETKSIEFGGASIPVSDTAVLTIDSAKELSVTFAEKALQKPKISENSPSFTPDYTYDGETRKAIIGLAAVDFGYGYTISECGYVITNEDGKAITLSAVAVPENGKFGIRAFGAALNDGTYTMKPYAKLSDGTFVYGTEQTVTIK